MNASPRSWLIALIGIFAAVAHAEVRELKPDSFMTRSVVLVDLPPAQAWRALRDVSGWWDPAHTWSGSARNLRLDPRAGGCFCESLGNGGSVQHGRVIFAQPAKVLRIDGALGPLQDMAVTGRLTFTLAPDGPGTRITLVYRVSGALTMDSAQLAPGVDQVLAGQLDRLRGFANGRARR